MVGRESSVINSTLFSQQEVITMKHSCITSLLVAMMALTTTFASVDPRTDEDKATKTLVQASTPGKTDFDAYDSFPEISRRMLAKPLHSSKVAKMPNLNHRALEVTNTGPFRVLKSKSSRTKTSNQPSSHPSISAKPSTSHEPSSFPSAPPSDSSQPSSRLASKASKDMTSKPTLSSRPTSQPSESPSLSNEPSHNPSVQPSRQAKVFKSDRSK